MPRFLGILNCDFIKSTSLYDSYDSTRRRGGCYGCGVALSRVIANTVRNFRGCLCGCIIWCGTALKMEYPLPIQLLEFNYYEDKAIVSIFLTYKANILKEMLRVNFRNLNEKNPKHYPKPPEYLGDGEILL